MTTHMAETPRRKKVVNKIIGILRDAGKPEPVNRKTSIGDLVDVILPMINSAFFSPGHGFRDGEIDSGESVAQLATEVIQLQDKENE
jgi:hypothetical protein